MIKEENYLHVSNYIYQVLERTRPVLELDIVEAVVYNEMHGEYEVALDVDFWPKFESFVKANSY